jgi:hypothetical protein
MATVIDELILQLNLDSTKFTAGQQAILESLRKLEEAAKKGGKETEDSGRRLLEFFTKIKTQAVGLFAAFVGGRDAKQFAEYITELDASTGRLCRTMGISVEQISLWERMVKLSGGSTDDARASLQSIQTEINKVSLGMGSALPAFLNTLQINMHKTNGEFKNASELLVDIHKAVQGRDPKQAASLMASMGIGPDTLYTLGLIDADFKKLMDRAIEIGGATHGSAVASQELVNAWRQAELAAEELGRTITVDLNEPLVQWTNRLTTLFGLLTKLEQWLDASKWIKMFTGGGAGILNFIPGAGPLAGILNSGPLLDKILGSNAPGSSSAPTQGTNVPSAPQVLGTPTKGDPRGLIPFIRQEAVKVGIDPDQAVRVAQSEGLMQFLSGIPGEKSYGAFQLHTGGGLGDVFKKETGLDPSDPANEQATISWALKYAAAHGWGPWHGWTVANHGAPWAGINVPKGGGPAAAAVSNSNNNSRNSTVNSSWNINNLNVASNDGSKFFGDLQQTLDRQGFAVPVNPGMTG